MKDLIKRAVNAESNILSDVAEIPQIKRGLVFCHECGRTEPRSAANFKIGWPKCCGYTMSLDSPEERASLRARSQS